MDEYTAYKDASLLPPLRPRQIFVDMEAEAVIVPINGMAVPFHIATIKNASKSDEGHFTYLRINFHVPVSIGPQNRSNYGMYNLLCWTNSHSSQLQKFRM